VIRHMHTRGVAASTLALARVLNCSNNVSATGGRNMCDTIHLMAHASIRTTKHSHACRKQTGSRAAGWCWACPPSFWIVITPCRYSCAHRGDESQGLHGKSANKCSKKKTRFACVLQSQSFIASFATHITVMSCVTASSIQFHLEADRGSLAHLEHQNGALLRCLCSFT
jgi:hypothetical protein